MYSVLEGCVPEALRVEVQLAREEGTEFAQVWNMLDARYAIYQTANIRERLKECVIKSSKVNSDDWREFYARFTKCIRLMPEMTEAESYVKLMEKIPERLRRKICEREIRADQKEPTAIMVSSVNFEAGAVIPLVLQVGEVRPVEVTKTKAGEYRVVFANEGDRKKAIARMSNSVIRGEGGEPWICI